MDGKEIDKALREFEKRNPVRKLKTTNLDKLVIDIEAELDRVCQVARNKEKGGNRIMESRLEQLLDKADMTTLEEVELEQLLQDERKRHHITYDNEYGFE